MNRKIETEDVALSWVFFAVLWAPVILHTTGLLVPTVSLLSEMLREFLSIMGNPDEVIRSGVGVESSPKPSPEPTQAPDNLSPAETVAVGTGQLIGAGIVIVFGIVFGVAGLVGIVVYLLALVWSAHNAFATTRAYARGGVSDAG